MSSRISAIAAKLEKLVLMLSSDQPGEVVAAAAAIKRTLRTAGADFHDLARGLTGTATSSSSSTSSSSTSSSSSSEDRDWRPLHAYCKCHLDELSSREQDFMSTLDRWKGNITERQGAWLEAIHDRLRRQEEP
jgi:hypothetical protein